jgi:hypothetical protein
VIPFRRSIQLGCLLALPCAAAAACGGTTSSDSGTDTSTNWLKRCSEHAECELGSTCACGRCTRECATDEECSVFAANAVCEAPANACAGATLCMPGAAGGSLGSSTASATSCSHGPNDYTLTEPPLCFGRELPECAPGSQPFFDACGCGCSAAPDYPRACRDQCELAGNCEHVRFEDFPDYATTLADWDRMTSGAFEALVAGECAGGRRFLYTANGTTSEARIYTSSGAFLGLGTSTDAISEVCWGQGYWPEPVRCERATVTEVLNAALGLQEVGQVVELPWADGPPEPFY